MSDIRAVLTDIEGTTSSIDFVKDVLFPYARQHLPAFVETHADDPEVQHWLHEAAKEAGIVQASRTEIIDLLIRWIDEDRKATPLKALQGMIWRQGYESKAYVSHMYPEVAARLKAWHDQGLKLYVYSSGSVPAQKLMFGFSENGDLTQLFSGYFDTQTGHKREVESYRRIAEAIGLPPAQVLFLSDIKEELDAARAAGMHTTHLIRPPQPLVDAGHPAVTDFDAITP
ncbi:acireductone synthase [Luteibacter anthropi]|uniref:Enolase-phosphatase E1 n=1 Tax=Luteibacter anthropi TaxID=564369 RepID=A0A7X5U899_9GAMM|nr:acireductone synthase [Luteibacter anthropi]NII05694.1 acireductone synthase [Luteibacter anthropi]URX61914.1 acireductone synthase [Luteibacter anthropi]